MAELKFAVNVALKFYKFEIVVLILLSFLDAVTSLLIFGSLIPLTIRLIGINSFDDGTMDNTLSLLGLANIYRDSPYLFLGLLFLISMVLTFLRSYYIAVIGANLNQKIKLSLSRTLSNLSLSNFLRLEEFLLPMSHI